MSWRWQVDSQTLANLMARAGVAAPSSGMLANLPPAEQNPDRSTRITRPMKEALECLANPQRLIQLAVAPAAGKTAFSEYRIYEAGMRGPYVMLSHRRRSGRTPEGWDFAYLPTVTALLVLMEDFLLGPTVDRGNGESPQLSVNLATLASLAHAVDSEWALLALDFATLGGVSRQDTLPAPPDNSDPLVQSGLRDSSGQWTAQGDKIRECLARILRTTTIQVIPVPGDPGRRIAYFRSDRSLLALSWDERSSETMQLELLPVSSALRQLQQILSESSSPPQLPELPSASTGDKKKQGKPSPQLIVALLGLLLGAIILLANIGSLSPSQKPSTPAAGNSVPTSNQTPKLESLELQALEFEKAGSLDQAIDMWQQFLDAGGSRTRAVQKLGQLHLKNKGYKLAVDYLSETAQLAPTYQAYEDLGDAYYQADDKTQAFEAFDNAIALNPTDSQLFIKAGKALRGVKRWRESRMYFRQAIDLEPAQKDPLLKYLDQSQSWKTSSATQTLMDWFVERHNDGKRVTVAAGRKGTFFLCMTEEVDVGRQKMLIGTNEQVLDAIKTANSEKRRVCAVAHNKRDKWLVVVEADPGPAADFTQTAIWGSSDYIKENLQGLLDKGFRITDACANNGWYLFLADRSTPILGQITRSGNQKQTEEWISTKRKEGYIITDVAIDGNTFWNTIASQHPGNITQGYFSAPSTSKLKTEIKKVWDNDYNIVAADGTDDWWLIVYDNNTVDN